ncbi:Ser/Thr protein kinase RdoA (MazF antagonist) [Paenibacillus taihuensis]|uniref:Ser/Thr protein kinase RdoA (MazF antagonist) n=1 Tax=Paenibacillus taihuensis TaxID=1156355 RepID=A0A3D9SC79_9BACL|nr:aminoglycoside phosphotransferase family protein [Paenibacillus taihuensis]REE88928.1 Ser/Thr protein kinase RdoA (MazF antagonist) [Paenibacillus taihuensis]
MDDKLAQLLREYGIASPEITLLRHNENRTFKVTDTSNGTDYLLRVHDPITTNLAGVQHTRHGIESELQLLRIIAQKSNLVTQVPLTTFSNQLVTPIEVDGHQHNCSILRWIEGRNLTLEDSATADAAYQLGAQVAALHQVFDAYTEVQREDRPDYGIRRIEQMLTQIRRGVELELFSPDHYATVEKTLTLIADRLKSLSPQTAKQGIIHADLNMSNILVTPRGEFVFIDYSLFGFGYRLFDVAMMALNAPKETREHVLKGYFGQESLTQERYAAIEGFMLSAVFGYYAFVMEHEAAHSWIRERMPLLCENRCKPFLNGERIFLSF